MYWFLSWLDSLFSYDKTPEPVWTVIFMDGVMTEEEWEQWQRRRYRQEQLRAALS